MSHSNVYITSKKDGSPSYRASITYKAKHISLGSYGTLDEAQNAYLCAKKIITDLSVSVDTYKDAYPISLHKYIVLLNYRDNGIYFHNPIYLKKNYFEYYLSTDITLKFDRDDLFFYSSHKIQKKGGYLFVCDYGSQYKILSRYGIRPFAVCGRDYIMVNGDIHDFRYSNIKIINSYTGVKKTDNNYSSYIHINGNYNIGTYDTEEDAAIAYNKAVDIVRSLGIKKAYIKNFISSISSDEYKKKYYNISVSDKLYNISGI